MADPNSLEEGLMKDLSEAETARAEEAQAIGSVSEGAQTKARVTALRSKKGVVFQRELDENNEAINQAAKILGQEAHLLDQQERAKFEAAIRKKLQAAQLRLIEKGGEFDKRLRARGIEQEKKYAFYRALGVGVGSAASAGVQSAGSGGGQQQNQGRNTYSGSQANFNDGYQETYQTNDMGYSGGSSGYDDGSSGGYA